MIQQPTLHIQWYLHISSSHILGVSLISISLALLKHRQTSISITSQKVKRFFRPLGHSESYWLSFWTELSIRIFKEKVGMVHGTSPKMVHTTLRTLESIWIFPDCLILMEQRLLFILSIPSKKCMCIGF